jgi:hypothetical protein
MADTDNHKAECACGQLTVEVAGEPEYLPICGCRYCRKRTGSVYGAGAYFNTAQVRSITGDSTVFRRGSDSERYIEGNFCPTCGTTLYWRAELWPERMAVAVGCFDDFELPQPQVAVFTEHIQDWAGFDDAIPFHAGARPLPPK